LFSEKITIIPFVLYFLAMSEQLIQQKKEKELVSAAVKQIKINDAFLRRKKKHKKMRPLKKGHEKTRRITRQCLFNVSSLIELN
jgi:hypothetical protein